MSNKRTNLPVKRTQLIPENGGPLSDSAVDEVIDRAQAGDESVAEDVQRLLAHPSRTVGLSVQTPLAAAVTAASGKNVLARETAFHELRQMKRELEGPSPTALETILVDRVVACWYFLEDAEQRYVTALNGNSGMSFALGDYHQRRMTAAQKRYNAAVLTLVNVRKMQLPDVTIQNQGQVNIANQQVNVAQPPPGPQAAGIHTEDCS